MATIVVEQATNQVIIEKEESSMEVVITPIGLLPDLSNYLQTDGVVKITVGPTEPVSPSVGDLWVDTS